MPKEEAANSSVGISREDDITGKYARNMPTMTSHDPRFRDGPVIGSPVFRRQWAES